MSNDKQLVKSFLNTLGIGFDELEDYDLTSLNGGIGSAVYCVAESHAKVGGYSGFEVEFCFDKDDKFVCMNIWE